MNIGFWVYNLRSTYNMECDISHETNLYLIRHCDLSSFTHYWSLMLLCKGQVDNKNVLLIPNVELKREFAEFQYFVVPRESGTALAIYSPYDHQYKITGKADGTVDEIAKIFYMNNPQFELCSPGLLNPAACKKWIHKRNLNKYNYVILRIENGTFGG